MSTEWDDNWLDTWQQPSDSGLTDDFGYGFGSYNWFGGGKKSRFEHPDDRALSTDHFDRMDWRISRNGRQMSDMFKVLDNSVLCYRRDERLGYDVGSLCPKTTDGFDELHFFEPYKLENVFADVFQCLVGWDPRSADAIEDGYRPNAELLWKFLSTEEIGKLRSVTRARQTSATFATVALQQKILLALCGMQEAAEAEAQARAALADALDAEQFGGEAESEAVEEAKAALQAAEEATEKAAEEQAAMLAAQLPEITEDIKKMQKSFKGFGFSTAEASQLSFDEIQKVIDGADKSAARGFLDIVGQFTAVAKEARRLKVEVRLGSISEVTEGNAIDKVIGSEYVNFASPELEDEFWLRFAKSTLKQHVMVGESSRGRGPVIFCGDESSSMEGLKSYWMKALAHVLFQEARAQNRDFIYLGYADFGELFERALTSKRTRAAAVMEMSTHFYNGGTNFNLPMKRAIELIGEYASRGSVERPDIVFCSDGEGYVSHDVLASWRDAQRRFDARNHGLQIGDDCGSTLAEFCDTVRKVSDLSDYSQMSSLFIDID